MLTELGQQNSHLLSQLHAGVGPTKFGSWADNSPNCAVYLGVFSMQLIEAQIENRSYDYMTRYNFLKLLIAE